jgi:hypothetical protein
MGQFVTEALIINTLSFFAALLIVSDGQEIFNNLVRHQLSLAYLFEHGLSGFSITVLLLGLLLPGFSFRAFIRPTYCPHFNLSPF